MKSLQRRTESGCAREYGACDRVRVGRGQDPDSSTDEDRYNEEYQRPKREQRSGGRLLPGPGHAVLSSMSFFDWLLRRAFRDLRDAIEKAPCRRYCRCSIQPVSER